jgi:hypothetical protein
MLQFNQLWLKMSYLYVIQIVKKKKNVFQTIEWKMLIKAEKEFAPHHMYLFLQHNVNEIWATLP